MSEEELISPLSSVLVLVFAANNAKLGDEVDVGRGLIEALITL